MLDARQWEHEIQKAVPIINPGNQLFILSWLDIGPMKATELSFPTFQAFDEWLATAQYLGPEFNKCTILVFDLWVQNIATSERTILTRLMRLTGCRALYMAGMHRVHRFLELNEPNYL